MNLYLATIHGIQLIEENTKLKITRQYFAKETNRYFYYIPAKDFKQAEKEFVKWGKKNGKNKSKRN